MSESSVPAEPASEIVYFVDVFPELSETFVINEIDALVGRGLNVRVEARWRADRADSSILERVATFTRYAEDEPSLRQLVDSLWLVVHHPIRCLGDVWASRRWWKDQEVLPLPKLAGRVRRLKRAPDPHVHAHFAAGSALDALRVRRLCRVPYSVAAHAY